MKKLRIFPLILALSLLLSTGAFAAAEQDAAAAAATAPVTEDVSLSLDPGSMFTDRDVRESYDVTGEIFLSDSGIESDSAAVVVDGSTVTITDEGVYRLTGSLSDGMVIVDADSADKIQLVLDGVSIACSTSAAIYVRQADKVFITLDTGTQNELSNGGSFKDIDENSISAVIYARDDLTFNGSGSLTVSSPAGNGVDAKDDLVIAGGSYDITAGEHGFEANDSIRIAGGTFRVSAGKDAFHAENSDDATLGYIYIADGDFDISTDGDGISAGGECLVAGGVYSIVTGGGSENAEPQTQGFFSRLFTAGQTTEAETDSESGKGLKSGASMVIEDGIFVMDTIDDAVHSNADISVCGGEFSLQSGDDGFHADETLSVSGGVIDIAYCYEGLEGTIVDISGGDISVIALDDGVNAAGGADGSGMQGMRGFTEDFSSAASDAYICISGGTIGIANEGDGLDANGSLYVTGGEVLVAGCTGGENSAIDCDGQSAISGGIFIGCDCSQMAQNFGAGSTQGAIMVSAGSQQAGVAITLTDSSGAVLASCTAEKAFTNLIVSCPGLTVGEAYVLTAGTYEEQITLSSLVYGAGGMTGGAAGGKNRW